MTNCVVGLFGHTGGHVPYKSTLDFAIKNSNLIWSVYPITTAAAAAGQMKTSNSAAHQFVNTTPQKGLGCWEMPLHWL